MNKNEINKFISKLNGDSVKYDLRCGFQIVHPDLLIDDAKSLYEKIEPENRHLYSITRSKYIYDYTSNLETALNAISNIAKRDNKTFVLSFEDGSWKAAFGGYKNCSEVKGDNPSFVSCQSVFEYYKGIL